MSKTNKLALWFCGSLLAVVGFVANAGDTEKHEQQQTIQNQIDTVRNLERVGFPTVTTTTLSPFVAPR